MRPRSQKHRYCRTVTTDRTRYSPSHPIFVIGHTRISSRGLSGSYPGIAEKSCRAANDPFADVATSCHSARMGNRGLSILCMLAVLAAGALWWVQSGSMTDDQRLLFSKLDAATANTPPRASDLIEAFGLPETCREKTCYLEPGKIGGLRYDGGNLRQSEDGIVFVLEGLAGSCIRTDQAQAYYSAGKPEEQCSHGGCWSTQAQYSWGILGFGLGKSTSQCVSSIAINSLPYQRRKQ